MPVAVNGGAAFSEYSIAKERMVTPVPAPSDGVLPVGPEAAVLTLSGVTAIASLEVGGLTTWCHMVQEGRLQSIDVVPVCQTCG